MRYIENFINKISHLPKKRKKKMHISSKKTKDVRKE